VWGVGSDQNIPLTFRRLLKKAKYRSLTRAAQKRGGMFAGTYRAVTVKERWPTAFCRGLLTPSPFTSLLAETYTR